MGSPMTKGKTLAKQSTRKTARWDAAPRLTARGRAVRERIVAAASALMLRQGVVRTDPVARAQLERSFARWETLLRDGLNRTHETGELPAADWPVGYRPARRCSGRTAPEPGTPFRRTAGRQSMR
jgi:hypothetical protein